MSSKIYFRGTIDQAKDAIRQLAQMLVGARPDRAGVARGVFLAVGVAALSDVKADFVRKARGNTGEDGVKWDPLSPKTIANRRVGPRDIKNDEHIANRERIRKQEFRKAYGRYRAGGLSEEEARKKANHVAGIRATLRTGRTKVKTLGYRDVDILRDTGVLLNSLSPGQLVGDSYSKPSGDGGLDQIFDLATNGVVVGTNVLYSATHQYGDAKRNIPARPFLPERPPEVWRQRWLNAALRALEAGARLILGGNR